MNKQLRHLKNKEIDYEKWDECILRANNGNLYAKSWYLDIVSPNWEALVLGDYKFVMPLPVEQKFGLRMISQPLHCQQLGIFPAAIEDIQQQFAEEFYRMFKFIRYQLNTEMDIGQFKNFKVLKKTNYLLHLDMPFNWLSGSFTKHAKRNLTAAEKTGTTVVKGLQPSDFFEIKRIADNRKVPEKSYRILRALMAKTLTSGAGTIYAAYSAANSLCSAAFIVFDQSRAYYLNAFSTEEGRENRAMYLILNEIIKEWSDSYMTLDFEGSVIEGVARFYKGFGAQSTDYYYIHSDKVPLIGKMW